MDDTTELLAADVLRAEGVSSSPCGRTRTPAKLERMRSRSTRTPSRSTRRATSSTGNRSNAPEAGPFAFVVPMGDLSVKGNWVDASVGVAA